MNIASSQLKARLAALAIFSSVFFAFGLGNALGKSTEEKLDVVEQKIGSAKEREGVLTSEIEAMSQQISSLEGQVADLRSQELAAENELAAKEMELDRAVEKLTAAVRELEDMRGRLKRALSVLRERLVDIYMSGTVDLASIVLAASDYGEMVAASEYVEQIKTRDESLVVRVRELRDQAEALVEVRRETKSTIETARNQIAAEESRLESTRSSLESRENELVAAQGARQATLESVQGNIHKHEEMAADLRAKIEDDVAAATSESGPPVSSDSTPTPSSQGFIWPVEGAFTSPFGSRWGRMHEGIDIAAPDGTPIKAAASGTVALMQSEAESGGYGNYTCVDHGDGLATCYAHQSGFATSTGATVRQGEVIGYVGNTGNSFGAHLHFEVRINGSAVDPMGYL